MGRVAEDYKEEYPGLPTYLQCQSNAFVSGSIALFMAGTGTYFAQDIISKFLPWTKKAFILPAVAVGSIVSYKVTKTKTTACQEMWIALKTGAPT